MKSILLLISFVFLFTTSVFAAGTDTVISQEALMNMSQSERNAVFEALKKQKELQAEAAAAINTETVQVLANMDVETFKGKTMAVADTMVIFFDKLGVKANEFIKTDVGFLAAVGIVYKMGVFGSVWDSAVCAVGALIFLIILYRLNTKKVIKRHTYNNNGEIIATDDVIVPAFSAVSGDDESEKTVYSVIASIVCAVIIVVLLIYM